LAQDLGLSITTVSRALDGYDDVSAVTRERVRKAAAAVGYRPNAAARRLRKGASETIALVMPSEPGRFHEPAFVELLPVIGERLAAHHFDLMLLAARPGAEELAAYRRIIRDRRADGCILVRTRRADERVALLQEAGLPFVCHGRTGNDRPYLFVDGDGEQGFHDVTSRLIGLGHRRIALLGGPAGLVYSAYRLAGWREAMQGAGLAPDLTQPCEAHEEAGETAAAAMIARSDRPTALVCATDRIAIGAIRAAQRAGLEVGRDIAITGHDNIHAARFVQPSLTSMELDAGAAGRLIVDKLLGLIEGRICDEPGSVLPLAQIARASSGEAQDKRGKTGQPAQQIQREKHS
jgi:LacI family transcriptional regulator